MIMDDDNDINAFGIVLKKRKRFTTRMIQSTMTVIIDRRTPRLVLCHWLESKENAEVIQLYVQQLQVFQVYPSSTTNITQTVMLLYSVGCAQERISMCTSTFLFWPGIHYEEVPLRVELHLEKCVLDRRNSWGRQRQAEYRRNVQQLLPSCNSSHN